MKANHESFKDEKPLNDNELVMPTGLAQKKKKSKEKRNLPSTPKRKLEWSKHQSLYLIHLFFLPVFVLVGLLTNEYGLVFAIIPYGLMVLFLHRMGSVLSLEGLDYVLWNLSVLVSIFTNTKTPNLRKYGEEVIWGGAILLILMSLFSPWFMVFGMVVFLTGMVFAFAEKEAEVISEMSRIVSIGLTVTGVIGLFLSPGLALATLTISLLIHQVYEMWDDYEFNLE